MATALLLAGCATTAHAPPVETRTWTFESPEALAEWSQNGGDWKVEGGRAVGRSIWRGSERAAWLTNRTYFGSIDRVVVHGGLAQGSNHNFRLGVGAATFLFNWEGGNHSLVHYHKPQGVGFGPHVLEPGKEHEIVVEQVKDRIRLVLDDRVLWDEEGRLSGTVTVYPAFGSTVFLRDVSVTGRAVPWIDADWPSMPHF
jgi:hypothetical protein